MKVKVELEGRGGMSGCKVKVVVIELRCRCLGTRHGRVKLRRKLGCLHSSTIQARL